MLLNDLIIKNIYRNNTLVDEKTVIYKSLQDVVANLPKIFPGSDSTDLKDLWGFLQDFQKKYKIPEEIDIYVGTTPVDSLETLSRENISDTLLGNLNKESMFKTSSDSSTPAVIIKGNIRSVIIYGETSVLEAYLNKRDVKAIFIDIGDYDPFTSFQFNQDEAYLVVPLIEELIRKNTKK